MFAVLDHAGAGDKRNHVAVWRGESPPPLHVNVIDFSELSQNFYCSHFSTFFRYLSRIEGFVAKTAIVHT